MLKSRKFWLTVSAVTATVAGVIGGELTWTQAIPVIAGSIGALVFGIAIEDAGAKSAGGK